MYTFWNMLHDVIFNKGKTSEEFKDYGEDKNSVSTNDIGDSSPSSQKSSQVFDVSDEGASAFRSVFGDDNRG